MKDGEHSPPLFFAVFTPHITPHPAAFKISIGKYDSRGEDRNRRTTSSRRRETDGAVEDKELKQ